MMGRAGVASRSTRVRVGVAARSHLPGPVLLLVLLLLIPTTASFAVGSLRLTLSRLFLLASFVPTAMQIYGGKIGRPLPCDWAMLLFATWPIVALSQTQDASVALQSGGIHLLEALGPYLLARVCVTDASSFRGTVRLLTAVTIAMALFTVPEAITGKHLLRALFGGGLDGGIGRRMGLERAFGPFDHPILYGVFCASTTSLAWFVLSDDDRWSAGRLRRAGCIVVSTAASVSGGALTTMLCQFVAIVYDRLTRTVRRRWVLFAAGLAFVWVVIDLFSNRSPMRVFLTYLTFSPATAYNRLIIWEYGQNDVWNNPLFGIGFRIWSRPSWMHSTSMDNFWLVLAVRYGLPAVASVTVALGFLLVRVGRGTGPGPAGDRCRKAWVFTMAGLLIAGSTVHFWNSLFVYFFFLVGTAAWLAKPTSPNSVGARQAKRDLVLDGK